MFCCGSPAMAVTWCSPSSPRAVALVAPCSECFGVPMPHLGVSPVLMRSSRRVLFRFHGVVDGLGHNPAIFDEKRVGAVAHTRMLSFGCPLQERHASLYQAIRVQVRCFWQFLFEQPRKLSCAFTTSKDTSAFE